MGVASALFAELTQLICLSDHLRDRVALRLIAVYTDSGSIEVDGGFTFSRFAEGFSFYRKNAFGATIT